MSKVTKPSSPALRLPDRTWVTQPQEKAELLAATFSRKWILPPQVINEFAELPPVHEGADDFLALRTRRARQALAALRDGSATGPDLLPVRILRECSAELALPFCKLARVILRCGVWPRSWSFHWIFVLHKKLS
eukprot:15477666-Alexandrium_andersonii.AAC.1